MLLGHGVDVDQTLKNPVGHDHEELTVNITAGKNIGFRWNEITKSYELVTDLQTWDEPVPVERFLDKLTQEYAIWTVTMAAEEKGYEVEEQKVNTDGSVELLVTRWT
tara:strand:- start:897 stop:1217 length:321 start_codon:yes stop_codon:yes gene_type:complete